MKELAGNGFEKLLQKLQCSFLCCYSPVESIEWKEIPPNITWEQQKRIVDATVQHDLNQRYPIKVDYQLRFLKALIEYLEKNCESGEVHDSIYESYCRIQKEAKEDQSEKYTFKHYLLPKHDAVFTLRESKGIVTEGTTGLCSWPASQALADYLLQNDGLIENGTILELGAGTGLCGMILARCCKPKSIYMTDGSTNCVGLMEENIQRNFPDAALQEDGSCLLNNNRTISASHLSWDDKDSITDFMHKKSPTILLAADIIYDDSDFSSLASAIDLIFKLSSNKIRFLLAATQRNESTFKTFLTFLNNFGFSWQEVPVIPLEESNLVWDRRTPVKLLNISRS